MIIRSKNDYKFFLEADKKSSYFKTDAPRPFTDDVWKFQRLLRKVEYYQNCRKDPLGQLMWVFWRVCYERLSVKLGFTIPPNAFGPGLSIAHRGTIVVNGKARIGANCRLHVNVCIGTKPGQSNAFPKIGNNVYIGPGAKIYGDVQIADGIVIGANSVVTRSFLKPNITIAGSPAQKINDIGSEKFLRKGAELLG